MISCVSDPVKGTWQSLFHRITHKHIICSNIDTRTVYLLGRHVGWRTHKRSNVGKVGEGRVFMIPKSISFTWPVFEIMMLEGFVASMDNSGVCVNQSFANSRTIHVAMNGFILVFKFFYEFR